MFILYPVKTSNDFFMAHNTVSNNTRHCTSLPQTRGHRIVPIGIQL